MEGRRGVMLKRGLKRAKLFEIQKIVKRVKMLRQKKGSEAQIEKHKRKCDRFLEEMEHIKDLDLGDLSLKLLNNDSQTSRLLSLPEPPSCTEERSKWRLIHSKAIQQNLQALVTRSHHDGSDQEEEEEEEEEDEEEGMESGSVQDEVRCLHDDSDLRTKEVEDSESNKEGVEIKKELHVDDHSQSIFTSKLSTSVPVLKRGREERVKLFKSNKRSTIVSPGGKRVKIYSKSSQKIEQTFKRNRHRTGVGQKGGAILETNDRGKGRKLKSMFIGLAAESHTKRNDSIDKLLNPKNRMGQRARQRMWEEMYGQQANHLKTTPKSHAKADRRSSKRTQEVSKYGSLKMSGGRKEDKDIHPSWAASKRRKTQESNQLGFTGKHVVFDD